MGQLYWGADRDTTETLPIGVVVEILGRLVREEVVNFRHLKPRSDYGRLSKC